MKAQEPRVVYHGRYRRSSLFWLALSLLLGGVPLLVYFTEPRAPVSNLIAAVVVGIPCFVASLVALGKYKGLILFPGTGKIRYVEGLFIRRRSLNLDFKNIRQVELVCWSVPKAWEVHLRLADGEVLVLDEPNREDADKYACELAHALGVPLSDPLSSVRGTPSKAEPSQLAGIINLLIGVGCILFGVTALLEGYWVVPSIPIALGLLALASGIGILANYGWAIAACWIASVLGILSSGALLIVSFRHDVDQIALLSALLFVYWGYCLWSVCLRPKHRREGENR